MATVCVGCGLKVVGGVVAVDGLGVGSEDDVGVVCKDDGVDYVVPAMARRGINSTITSGDTVATLGPNRFSNVHDSAAGVLQVRSDGTILVLQPGVYNLNLMGGCYIPPGDEVHKLIGGRARIVTSGTVIASSGFVALDPEVDFSGSGDIADGPEFSCSVTLPFVAGLVIDWEVIGQVGEDDDGVGVYFPSSVNLLSIARLGSIRS